MDPAKKHWIGGASGHQLDPGPPYQAKTNQPSVGL